MHIFGLTYTNDTFINSDKKLAANGILCDGENSRR